MTAFLASVRNVTEARLVLDAGVDVLDVKEPAAGALGAVPDAMLREIVTCSAGAIPVSATIGDISLAPEFLQPAIERTWQAGVDIVKVGVFADMVSSPVNSLLSGLSARGIRIVLVYFAEHWHGDLDHESVQQAGVMGVMLDTRDKNSGSLVTRLGNLVISNFIRQAHQAGLVAGIAGSLRECDIAEMLALAPDYLGFRGALCGAAGRAAKIDGVAVRRISDQIRNGGPPRSVLARRGNRLDSSGLMSA